MLEITWLGHSCFQLRLESGEVFLLDPWLENPKAPKDFKVERLDAILLSHGHFDHLGDVVNLSKKFSAPVVSNFEIARYLEMKGVEQAFDMNHGGTRTVGPISVSMTAAIHSSSMIEDGKIVYLGEPAGLVLHPPDGRRAYFAGDTAVFSDMALIKEIYQPELAFLPIGDHYTMGPREASVACRLLKPKKVIPMHYGTFPILTGTPKALADLIKDSGTEVWELQPGKPVKW